MKLIAITTPDFRTGEDHDICRLIDRGWERVHIRKPGGSLEDITDLIEKIPAFYYPAISIHDHFELAIKYGLGGVHLNSRFPRPPFGWQGMVSRSCHTIEEITQYSDLDYITLSPIFDSISKPGYRSRFTPETLRTANLDNAYALGGVTFARLHELSALGFKGAAMMSGAWKARTEILQFITHTDAGLEEAMRGGCRWVQLRMKEVSDYEFAKTAEKVLQLCQKYGSTLIFDDRVHLVKPLGADGVHLGKKDMPIYEARKMLGPSKIIGATANTEEDISEAYNAGADYIGLGPFRFTTTKKGLSPILGLYGYHRLMTYCRENRITVPVVAIGGIGHDDIVDLRNTGVSGIAVSGLIHNSSDIRNTITEIIRLWKN